MRNRQIRVPSGVAPWVPNTTAVLPARCAASTSAHVRQCAKNGSFASRSWISSMWRRVASQPSCSLAIVRLMASTPAAWMREAYGSSVA